MDQLVAVCILGSVWLEIACSPCASGLLSHSTNMSARNVCEVVYPVSPCCSAMDWQPVQACPPLNQWPPELGTSPTSPHDIRWIQSLWFSSITMGISLNQTSWWKQHLLYLWTIPPFLTHQKNVERSFSEACVLFPSWLCCSLFHACFEHVTSCAGKLAAIHPLPLCASGLQQV